MDRWAAHRQMTTRNSEEEKKQPIKINRWIDYFNYINEKLNIQISKDTINKLIAVETEFQLETEYSKYKKTKQTKQNK